MSLSDTASPVQARLLDEVKAKIFYLASDVEPASRPAAMLLRAVAESIGDNPEGAERLNGHPALNGLAAALDYGRAGGMRSPGHQR